VLQVVIHRLAETGKCAIGSSPSSFHFFNNEGVSGMNNLYRCCPLVTRFRLPHATAIAALFFGAIGSLSAQAASPQDGYSALVRLFQEWREFEAPVMKNNVPDYSASAMAVKAARLPEWRKRLDSIDPKS